MSDYPEQYRERLRQILQDPAWAAAIETVKADLYSEWNDQTDAMQRDTLYHTRQGLDRLTNRLGNLAHG